MEFEKIKDKGVGVFVGVSAASGQKTKGEVRIQSWTPQQRLKRALKILAICWGMALVSIVIPLAHFILVPGFFLAGPIACFFVYNQKSVILGGISKCPKCGAVLPLERGADKWPLSDLCTNCQTVVTVEKLN